MNNYPEPIIKAIETLCDEIKKHYPKIFEVGYDGLGFPVEKGGITFQSRMEMGVYIELCKAGAFDK